MKTLKALRITTILNSIFCVCCIVFAVCITIRQYYKIGIVKTIGVIATFGWMLNPSPVAAFLIGLEYYRKERRSAEARQLIGRKYIWIFVWPVITTLFYFIAMGFFVEITGGV